MQPRTRKLNPDPGPVTEPTPDQPTRNELMVYAGRLLARREYAVRELEARLLRKWAGVEQIESRVAELIDTLQANCALSDTRYAESYIRSRRQRYHGPIKIRAELRQRQVPESIIEEYLQQQESDWTPLATAWLSHQHQGPLDFAARAKYYRRLMSRGFSHQQAMDALATGPSLGPSPGLSPGPSSG